MADAIGDTADGPSGQIVVCLGGQVIPGLILSHTSRRRSRSSGLPFPSIIRCSNYSSQFVPSRHGAHLPQDSREKNLTTLWHALTMSVFSSMTTIAPDPSIEPA